MFIRTLGFLAVLMLVGCNTAEMRDPGSGGVLGPSTVSEPAVSPAPRSTPPNPGPAVSPRPGNVVVNMHDACDPATFNAAIEEGACVRNGGVKFDQFIEQLTRLGFVGPWHFAPKVVNARTGQKFFVVNQGGE